MGASACVVAVGLWLAACDRTDPIAPADSTITVSANPQTVVVPSGAQGTTDIIATVRSKSGARLPGQEVTFSTTSGTLDPPAESTVLTDNSGQAISVLTTNTSATVTARSGGISATTQVQTSTGVLSQFILDVNPTDLFTCADVLMLTAEVDDPNGAPIQGIRVTFAQVAGAKVTGTFSPSSQVTSGVSGLAEAMWTPIQSICESKCTIAGDPNGGGDCNVPPIQFTASDSTGAFKSAAFTVTENIP